MTRFLTTAPLACVLALACVATGCQSARQQQQQKTARYEQKQEKWLVDSLSAEKTPALMLAYAGVLEDQKQLDQARDQYLAVVAAAKPKDKKATPATPDQIAAAELGLARLDAADENDASAVARFEKLVGSRPSDAAVLRTFGQYQFSKNRLTEAESLLRRAVAADKKDRHAKIALAQVLVRTQRIDESRSLLTSVLGNSKGRQVLASELVKQGQRSLAQNELAAAMQADPGNREVAQEYAALSRLAQQQRDRQPQRMQQPQRVQMLPPQRVRTVGHQAPVQMR